MCPENFQEPEICNETFSADVFVAEINTLVC